jgi:hypothetical protein
MDLYGDLLPVHGGGNQESGGGDSKFITSSGWANIEPKSKELFQSRAHDSSTTSDKGMAATEVAAAAKPMSFALKPRQAKKSTNASKSSLAPAPTKPDVSMVATPAGVDSTVAASAPAVVDAEEYPAIPIGSFEVDIAVEGEAYDPRQPNDYLQICRERKERKRSAELAEQNSRRMQERAREEDEAQRRRQEAYERGDMGQLQQLAAAVGAGRGYARGQTNLPAWMTKASTADSAPVVSVAQTGDTPSLVSPPVSRRSLLITSPSCVLLLLNMAGQSGGAAVDIAGLAREVEEECARYGAVRRCVVHRPSPSDAASLGDGSDCGGLWTLVQFGAQEHAIKALRDLNGRFFDGQRISASFYPEEKFSELSLR